jgi:hypothetical protein
VKSTPLKKVPSHLRAGIGDNSAPADVVEEAAPVEPPAASRGRTKVDLTFHKQNSDFAVVIHKSIEDRVAYADAGDRRVDLVGGLGAFP